jgi:hypothetical protein
VTRWNKRQKTEGRGRKAGDSVQGERVDLEVKRQNCGVRLRRTLVLIDPSAALGVTAGEGRKDWIPHQVRNDKREAIMTKGVNYEADWR